MVCVRTVQTCRLLFFVCHAVNEIDEIWQVDRGSLAVLQGQDWLTLTQEVPWGAKRLKGVKNCNAFLVHCLLERD